MGMGWRGVGSDKKMDPGNYQTPSWASEGHGVTNAPSASRMVGFPLEGPHVLETQVTEVWVSKLVSCKC